MEMGIGPPGPEKGPGWTRSFGGMFGDFGIGIFAKRPGSPAGEFLRGGAGRRPPEEAKRKRPRNVNHQGATAGRISRM
jgi:hypothetical protein